MAQQKQNRNVPVAGLLGVLVSVALVVAGILLEVTWPYLLAGVMAIVVTAGASVRLARTYTPFLKRWRALSESARSRMRGEYRRSVSGRNTRVMLIIIAVAMTLACGLLAVRAEIIRGADLDQPGRVFVVYNRLAAPDLAELIDLFVVRDLPLEQTDTSDLRILRSLYFAVEGYSFTSKDLQLLFGNLIWYQPYRAFPNDINALPESYQRKVETIMRLEASRN